MAYTVFWRTLPGKQLIRSEQYSDLGDALASADVVKMGGPSSVEITVIDETGAVHLIRIVSEA